MRADERHAGGNRDPRFSYIWTCTDAFPTTFHAGNTGSNPVGDAMKIKGYSAICVVQVPFDTTLDSHGIAEAELTLFSDARRSYPISR
jgi:hypothetical protein